MSCKRHDMRDVKTVRIVHEGKAEQIDTIMQRCFRCGHEEEIDLFPNLLGDVFAQAPRQIPVKRKDK